METGKHRPPHRWPRPGRGGQSGSHLRREYHDVEINGRWKNICGVQRCAWRRRLPAPLDQHGKFADHRAQLRPGRGHQRERRRDVEQLVQSANRPVLSRHYRQSFSLLGLRFAARKRLRRYAEPQRLWRNHVSRLASHRNFRVWIHRRRSARSEHSVWRLAHAIKTRYRRVRESYAGAHSPRRVSLCAHAAGCFFAARTAHALFRGERTVQNDGCGKQLAGYQSGSHARILRDPREPRCFRRERSGKREASRCNLRRRSSSRGAKFPSSKLRTSMRARRTRRSIRSGSTIYAHTFTARAISANRGWKLLMGFLTAAPATWCAKIRFARVCCTRERKAPSTFRLTMETIGSRYSSICRTRPCAISRFMATISLSPRTAALSGFSMTSRRCGK